MENTVLGWLSATQTNLARLDGQRQKIEQALLVSENKFRSLYDLSSDAIMLLDDSGFIDCNAATLNIFDCATSAEFCTKHPVDLSPPTQSCGTDSKSLAEQKMAIAKDNGYNLFEWMHKRIRTGEIFPAEVLLSSLSK